MLEHPRADEHYSLTEMGELMLEIACTESLDLDTALDRAAAQLDELTQYYPYLWDSTAFTAGNWAADARVIPF